MQGADDFATLFSHFWNQDFPVDPTYRPGTLGRADWTIHIGIVVRRVADLLGLFTHFESGGRTDAVIKDNAGKACVYLEWEWGDPAGELDKLAQRSASDVLCVLVCYQNDASGYARTVSGRWSGPGPLILVTIQYTDVGRSRRFEKLVFHRIIAGRAPKLLRQQPALPWKIPGTRWQRNPEGE